MSRSSSGVEVLFRSLAPSPAWRAAGLLVPAALAACSPPAQDSAKPASPAPGEERIACALGGADAFVPECTVVRQRKDGIVTLVVRHPDGGFRRFMVLDNGRGLAVADGATQAIARYEGGFAELAVERDRYRFPITVKSDAGR